MLATLNQDLSQPEYIHVLINPLPVYGLFIAVIGLIIGLLQRSRKAQIAPLILILLSASIVWPVVHFGEAGYDRVLSLSDDQGGAWLRAHMHRADQFAWAFYVLAGLASLALLLPWRWPKLAAGLTIVTLLCSLAVLAAGGYIAYAGGKIRHREFRNEPAPMVPVEQDEH
jgi:formate hydrogenlyase subunit 3/multisubunit Na+/H+ antiporter MnhD subunit